MFDNSTKNSNMATYINEYEFHFNTVKLEISCDNNNLLYGIYPLRLINWLTTQVKRKLLYKNACRLTDKYEFYSEVLGAVHPSAKDVETLNQAFNSLANAKFTIETSKSTYENISIFDGDVSWLWADASQWQPSLPLSAEFVELASKHSCPISKQAQYDLYGSELILFNFFMYQNYCLNESARNYTYHINQLMDVLQMPCNGSVSLKNNKYKIIDLCSRIKAKTGLKLNYVSNGIEVQPNVDALLVQPLKTIKTVTGKVILTQKEVNIYSKTHSDLDVARAMYCVQYRINNGLKVDNPKKYMWWFLKEKDGKASKSMYKAGLALKDALYKKYKTISVNGDANNPSQSEMLAALDITAPNNKPTTNMLSEWQRHDAIECYKMLNHHINHYKQISDSKPLDHYMYYVWLIATQQIIPHQLQQSVEILLQIPKVKQLAEKYKKSKQQLSELEDLSNFLFGSYLHEPTTLLHGSSHA
jgi:hypothetical protein